MIGRANINKGVVSKTNGQVKRHVSTMSHVDISKLRASIKMVPDLFLGSHVFDKIENQGLYFSPQMITEVLVNVRKRNIIEYNITPTREGLDRRVLLRSDESYPVKITNGGSAHSNICFVLSLETGKVVTVYWNKLHDKHQYLDPNRYSDNLEII